eukprot:g33198.t1
MRMCPPEPSERLGRVLPTTGWRCRDWSESSRPRGGAAMAGLSPQDRGEALPGLERLFLSAGRLCRGWSESSRQRGGSAGAGATLPVRGEALPWLERVLQ